jgi:hypothetical protein
MNTTRYEKGLEKGEEKGREKGRRELLCEMLDNRFGPLSPDAREKVNQLTSERFTALTKAVLHASSLRDLGLEDLSA